MDIYKFIKNCQKVLHSDCCILHSYQQCIKASLGPHLYCYLKATLAFAAPGAMQEVWLL